MYKCLVFATNKYQHNIVFAETIAKKAKTYFFDTFTSKKHSQLQLAKIEYVKLAKSYKKLMWPWLKYVDCLIEMINWSLIMLSLWCDKFILHF